MTVKSADRVALALSAAFLAALLWAGPVIHPHESFPETDYYAEKAQNIAEGRAPDDPYHTLLYHLLTAALGRACGDFFAAGRFLSACFAAVFVWYAYKTARRAFGPWTGLFTLAAAATNPFGVLHAFIVNTDMAFAALSMLFFHRLLVFAEKPDARRAAAAGAAFGLAFFAREAAILHVPAAAAALFFVPRAARLRLAAVLFASMLVFSLPAALTQQYFSGTWPVAVHWKNLALRMYGTSDRAIDWDYVYRRDLPFDGWFSVISSSPSRLASVVAEELRNLFTINLPTLYGTRALGFWTAVLAFAGMARAAVDRRPARTMLAVIFWSNALTLCAFFTWTRYLLPVMPIGYAFAAGALRAGSGYRRAAGAACSAFLLAMIMARVGPAVDRFARQHPTAELEATLRIDREENGKARIVGTFRPLRRRVQSLHRTVPAVALGETQSSYLGRLAALLKDQRAGYLVVGEMGILPEVERWTAGQEAATFLEPYFSEKGVRVYRVKKDAV